MKTNPANDEKVKMSNIFQQESLDVNLLADMSLGFSLLPAMGAYSSESPIRGGEWKVKDPE